ncbi:MAG: hypothetical protein ACREJ3_12615, partial [Polyangiaceae bacterium]
DREFEATNRPWVSVDVTSVQDLIFSHGMMPTSRFAFTLRNGGKTPATQVVVEYAIAPPNVDYLHLQREIAARGITSGRARVGGLTVFPGIPEYSHLPWQMEPAALRAWHGWLNLPQPGGSSAAPVYLVGCVTYRATYSGRTYQTGFIRALRAVSPETSSSVPVDPRGGDLAKDRIIFGPSEAGDSMIT